MSAIVSEWANLLIRWFHILAGISWIGSSFYFMWLDSHLTLPETKKPNVTGELWMVHSGGFYQVEKRLIAPGEMPKVLHWFKWEAFFTWLSGIFLLMVVYYLGGGIYLVDENVSKISVAEARVIGISLLVVSWIVYDGIWKSVLGQKFSRAATVISVLLAGLVTYGLSKTFSGRAAFIHVGAMFGTIMVANVWMRILPAQRKMIEATEKGVKPDYSLGEKAKQRSIHNNYMTFPVIFIMISNHFPSTYGNRRNWLILCGLIIASAMVRHIMNKRTKSVRWLFVPAAAIIAALFVMTSPHKTESFTDRDDEAHEAAFNVDPQTAATIEGAATLENFKTVLAGLPKTDPIAFPAGCAEQHQSAVTARPLWTDGLGGLRNVFVAVTSGLEGKYFAPPGDEVLIDQKGCFYDPIVVGAQTGQQVTFVNSDPVFHNVRSMGDANPVFNEGMQNKGMRLTKIFAQPELMVHVHCDVHPWMNAYIGIVSNPYFAVTGTSGGFSLKNIPPGTYTLTAWHETLGTLSQVITVGAHEAKK